MSIGNNLLGTGKSKFISVLTKLPCLKYKKNPVFADETPKLSFLYIKLNALVGSGSLSKIV